MDKKENTEEDRFEFNSVKIAHELMVDILGGLIPGAMFLFSIILCIVFPIICYANPGNKFGFLMKDGDWFWIVAFLSFLILSYVIGHIFYRADIKVPDRVDIRREQKKKLLGFIDRMPTGIADKDSEEGILFRRLRVGYAASLLLSEVRPLAEALEECREETPRNTPYNAEYLECCKKVEKYLRNLTRNPEQFFPDINDSVDVLEERADFRENILCILFPEAIKKIKDKSYIEEPIEDPSEISKPPIGSRHIYTWIAKWMFPELSRLPFKSRSVIVDAVKVVPLVHDFRFKAKWMAAKIFLFKQRLNRINKGSWIERVIIKEVEEFEPFNLLMVSYLVLHMQNESGCATEKRCNFPYMSYYKYLLKRRQYKLLKYAVWNSSPERTKNQINNYKIELQLYVPNAYSIISKNESHIRMASSTWHVAKTVKNIAWCALVLTIILSTLSCTYHALADSGEQASTSSFSKENVLIDDKVDKAMLNGSLEKLGSERDNNVSSNSTQISLGVKKSIPNTGNLMQNREQGDGLKNTSSKAISPEKKKCEEQIRRFKLFIKKFMPFIIGDNPTNSYLAIIFPLITLLFMSYLLNNVPRFIHYQRLREIFYTLRVYNIWQEAKRAKAHRDRQNLNIKRVQANMTPLDENCEPPFYF